jgi:hypothetical protein
MDKIFVSKMSHHPHSRRNSKYRIAMRKINTQISHTVAFFLLRTQTNYGQNH